jgi:hypothetical protein
MASMLDAFERARLREFAEYEAVTLPKKTWRTPNGQWWTPQSVLKGWRPRISDHWAWVTLHAWIVWDKVTVAHVELPEPLVAHRPEDEAWAFIDYVFGPGELEPLAHPVGRADLYCDGEEGQAPLMVEFGTCAPVKFLLNLGHNYLTHWMLVPYSCPYAFVFVAAESLFEPRNPLENTDEK